MAVINPHAVSGRRNYSKVYDAGQVTKGLRPSQES